MGTFAPFYKRITGEQVRCRKAKGRAAKVTVVSGPTNNLILRWAECPLLAQSGHHDRAKRCPLVAQSGHGDRQRCPGDHQRLTRSFVQYFSDCKTSLNKSHSQAARNHLSRGTQLVGLPVRIKSKITSAARRRANRAATRSQLSDRVGNRSLGSLGQSKRLQMRGLFANGDSLCLIFGHCFSSIPRALFLSETLFCPLSGLIWCHESFSCDNNVATTLRPLWC